MQQIPSVPQSPLDREPEERQHYLTASDNSVPNFSNEPDAEAEDEVMIGDVQNHQKDGWRGILSTILILIAAPLVAFTLITFVFQSYEVDGPSMETTLQNGDRLIVNKLPRTWSRITGNAYIPNRYDIVIFGKAGNIGLDSGQQKQLIKRVIGLPGDRVVVKNGVITIYNEEYPNGFNPDNGKNHGENVYPTPGDMEVVVGQDEVFVCGDNRSNSLDSRVFGPVPAADIVGKLAYRIFPISKAGGF